MKTDLYLIALLPPMPIREQVRALKLEMQRQYGAGHALKAPAHITLQMPFRLRPGLLRQLEDNLRQFSSTQQPFHISLNGFDCFAPRVIFIRLMDHGPLTEIEMNLKSALLEKQILPSKNRAIPFHPHMTIATRDLDEAAFYKAWADFKNRAFHAFFEVNSLHLLRHNGKYWDIFREYGIGK